MSVNAWSVIRILFHFIVYKETGTWWRKIKEVFCQTSHWPLIICWEHTLAWLCTRWTVHPLHLKFWFESISLISLSVLLSCLISQTLLQQRFCFRNFRKTFSIWAKYFRKYHTTSNFLPEKVVIIYIYWHYIRYSKRYTLERKQNFVSSDRTLCLSGKNKGKEYL